MFGHQYFGIPYFGIPYFGPGTEITSPVQVGVAFLARPGVRAFTGRTGIRGWLGV